MSSDDNITRAEFEKAYKKVQKGKKRLSDKKFTRFQTDDLNGLGKFYEKEVTDKNLTTLMSEFYSDKYKIKEYTCVVLSKGKDKYRTILVPKARDRIIFTVLLQRLKKTFLQKINEYNVFGSGERKDFKKIKDIAKEVHRISLQHKYVLKIDIESFFPSIDKEILLGKIRSEIKSELLFKILKSSIYNNIYFNFKSSIGITEIQKEKIIKSASKGIPQGCAYSPLLANYYALDFDKKVQDMGLVSFRYLDDMVIFSNTFPQAKEMLDILHLEAGTLKMKIHELSDKNNHKTYIQKTTQPFEYLGIEITPNGEFSIPIDKIKKEIKLIKSMIINQETIKRFSVSRVHYVLSNHIKGWKDYYENNFPIAYDNFKKNYPNYNEQLKNHYERHPSFLVFLKKRGIEVESKTLYL